MTDMGMDTLIGLALLAHLDRDVLFGIIPYQPSITPQYKQSSAGGGGRARVRPTAGWKRKHTAITVAHFNQQLDLQWLWMERCNQVQKNVCYHVDTAVDGFGVLKSYYAATDLGSWTKDVYDGSNQEYNGTIIPVASM
ncbi:hypothetical protein O0I10_000289 [Lichtheimia ornata]|uniref:Uncharacterized protein n=1 Tax=Lichtheimia ornata TaxID=688661 RepID=A0AAD7Y5A7_9FUNG|nr:uncharacterized protein O0I10_000289 [Lichtheimia ornata]KAJ8664011.1 hypothetical protein O0I10_000289 [Lichtheimia ornata]